MYTSYFYQLRNINRKEYRVVPICRSVPDWYEGEIFYQTTIPLKEYDGKLKVISNLAFRQTKGMVIVLSKKPISKYSLKLLAPMSACFKDYKNDKDFEKFTNRYKKEVLARLDAKAIAEALGDKSIFICHEAKEEECHRSIVREWFIENGIDCTIYIYI